jgi:MOSC domain-containing protein
VPTVSQINLAPVKGLGLVHPDEVMLGRTGVVENRRFHVVDERGRRYNQIRNGRLVQIRPDYDAAAERLTLSFPDGTVADGEVELGEPIVVDFYGRPVPGSVIVGPWGEALSSWAGRPLRLVQSAPGAAVDRARGEVSLVSEESLAELARQAGREHVDGRRFRMLFHVVGCAPHEEDEWVRRTLLVGDAVVRLRNDVGRCAITTQNPDSGVPDFDTLRTIDGYRGRTTNASGKGHIPFGMYGEIVRAGRVRVGDPVELLERSLLDATA